MRVNYWGLGLIGFATIAMFAEKLVPGGLSGFIAQDICGDNAFKEPDPDLAAQGILTEAACGFDADMYFVTTVAVVFVVGLMLIILRRAR